MTREYKFRGKSKEHGWVYGDLLQYPNGEVYIMEHSDGQDLSYLVDPDTVGQFTGLEAKGDRDCSEVEYWGIPIYEGDIIANCGGGNKRLVIFNHEEAKFVGLAELDYNNEPQKHWEACACAIPQSWLTRFCYKVIGNVHDHPELLEGGEQ